MTIPRPPSSIKDTLVFGRIRIASDDDDGLLSKANRFVETADPILDSIIGGPFKRYTLHNRDHARKLAHIADHVVSRDTIESLTPFECLLFIYSAYIHDMGLAVSGVEIDRFISDGGLTETLNSWPQLKSNLESLRSRLENADLLTRPKIELAISELHDIAATHYFRPRHATAERYRQLLARIRAAAPEAGLFDIRGVSFEDELIEICVSHNLGAAVLSELRNAHEERFPRRFVVSDHTANVQFIAALLRLTDILDFDFERTPRVLFDSLGLKHKTLPGSEVSLQEWEKHLAVQQLEIRDSEIVVKARCKHPAIEATVKQFCVIIEEEIRTTLSVLRRNEQSIVERYRFRIPSSVRPEIKSDGYKFLDLSLSLDESAVMSLLMGTSLYRTPYAAIRELIQNAADACTVRQTLRHTEEPPRIELTTECDEEQRHWIFVRDNGVGMDEYVLRSYFFKVGRSYYSSSDFDKLVETFGASKPALSSRFGIGFLACFMLADLVEVETHPLLLQSNVSSPKGLRVSIERLGALAYVQELDGRSNGTTVKLRLRHGLGSPETVISNLFEFVKSNVLRPAASVYVNMQERKLRIEHDDYHSLVEHPRPPEGIPQSRFRVVTLKMEECSNIFSGKVFMVFVVDDDGETLDVSFNGRLLTLDAFSVKDRLPVPAHYIFKTFTGNRVTVGGFKMQLPGIGKVLRHGSQMILPALFDIDITPGPHVNFDVARTRINDESMLLRIRLKEAIQTGLSSQGVWDKLADSPKRVFAIKPEHDPFRAKMEVLRSKNILETDEGILSRTLQVLPKDSWPVGIHRMVAQQLQIPNGKAFNAISTLHVEGRVTNPNLTQVGD